MADVPSPMDRLEAVLLLGPTASGKTPLGDALAGKGLWGRRCVHFDFGANLRDISAGLSRPNLTEGDVDVIRWSLESGALLENEHFPVAEKVLRSFLHVSETGADDLVVLNGLPRHAGQAADIDALLKVAAVVHLRCTPQTIIERIRADIGGDRAGRCDDDPAAVIRKLEIFLRRTVPLLHHYRARSADVIEIDVHARTTAEDVRRVLEDHAKK